MTEASPLFFAIVRIAVTVLVVAVGAGLWLWWGPRRRTLPRRLRVQDRLVVGRGVSLLLLEVEEQKLLVGVSSEGVRLVRSLGGAPPAEDVEDQAPGSRAARFSDLLGRAAGGLRR